MPPGPTQWPVVGIYARILSFLGDPAPYLRWLHQTYGDLVYFGHAAYPIVFAFSPQFIQPLLSDPTIFYNPGAEAGPIRIPPNTPMARIISGALSQMNGPRHKQQRRLLMPAFRKQRVEAYRDQMVALTEQEVAQWHAGQTLELWRAMKRLTLNIVVKALLGLDPAQAGQIPAQLERWQQLFFDPLAIVLPLNLPGLPARRLLNLSQQVVDELQLMIQRKRDQGLDEGDVLSLLIQARDEEGGRMTDDELIGQTMTLFVAGHETTANALTWTLFLLQQHPLILANLVDELDSQLHGDAPTVSQLEQLPLLEAVIKESMRLLPPFIWQLRIAMAPVELGGYDFPAGTHFGFSSIITQHRSDLYPQPYRFWPERWFTIRPTPYEYFPFSAGPRMCLGAALAMLELKIVLAIILQRYRLSLLPQTQVDRAGLMFSFPKKGLPMELHLQDRRFSKTNVSGNIHTLVDLAQ
jgi:cytochrome P450